MTTDAHTIAPGTTTFSELRTSVCIASIGHSGSTLLGMLLDQFAQITTLGELKNLAIYARDPQRRCTCGSPIMQCEFWLSVQDELRRRLNDPALDLPDYAKLPTADNRGFRKLPKLTDALLLLGSRRIWNLAGRVSAQVRKELTFGAHAVPIYQAVAAVRGTPLVVDSPTTATYMKVVYLADLDRCRLIDLVRDGRGWAASLMRREGVDVQFAARLCARRHWNMQAMLATIPKRKVLRVRYEDLCRNPNGTMTRVAAFLGVDPPAADFKLRKQDFHGVGGNPMRFRYDEVDIHLDEKWRTELSAADLRTFERIAGKQNRRLGYE